MAALLKLNGVGKAEEGRWLVKDISFALNAAQKLAVAGATGSGKTTLLKLIAGLAAPDAGTILFKEQRVKPPAERLIAGEPGIAYLSQYFELRNHYRVGDFLSMAVRTEPQKASELYALCRIDHLLSRWTHQLSGGEKQRIALARLLVAEPQLLLLDEPFSNLDPFHKKTLKQVIADVAETLHLTAVLVSHDPQDSLPWADQVLVLKEGSPVQQAPPHVVYRQPADAYTAALFGTYNHLDEKRKQVLALACAVPAQKIPTFLRPENITVVQNGNGIAAVVQEAAYLGGWYEVKVEALGDTFILLSREPVAKNEQLSVQFRFPED